jgi:hypothetical protein
MSQISLVNPQLVINNISVDYVPNSLDIDLGLGEQSVKALAGGGGTVDTVFFNNIESNIGIVKFDRYSTNVNMTFLQDWKALGDANTIQVQGEGNVVVTFQFMALTNRVEVMIGNEKQTSFEFQGNPAITN